VPPPETTDLAQWHRFFAMQGNNSAWKLAADARTAAQKAELLDVAHASAWHWKAIGTELNRMRVDMLLAEVHALLGHGATAMAYAKGMQAYFLGKSDTPDWELAFTHAVHAHAAHAAGEYDAHRASYGLAEAAVAAIKDEEDRAIVLETFRNVPGP
jgi:hypothetical protein